MPRSDVTRRATVIGLAAAAAVRPSGAASEPTCEMPADAGSPRFSPSGPDAERYGAAEGYPVSDPSFFGLPGEPDDPTYRVGCYSHFDDAYRTRRVARAATAFCFKRSRADVFYEYQGTRYSAADYVRRHPVTGLLIARDDTILFEQYQYGRSDKDRLFSGSMAKSIVGLLVGVAIADGAIASIDDLPEAYVPGFEGTEYGRTPIRDLLHMSSGIEFGEEANDGRDLDRLWIDMVQGRRMSGPDTIASITQFNRRIAPPGTRFAYASIEPDVLGLVLRHATGKSLCDYLHDRIWSQIGTEAGAAWLLDAQGYEVGHTFFGAVLRDYARLGRLLAHDGAWSGRQLIPAQWIMDATTTRDSDAYLRPGRASPGALGYGYLLWLLPGDRRQFVLLGGNGQRIFVDPPSKLVMVQTGVDPGLDRTDEVRRLWSRAVASLGGG